jgi:lysophospholipase L1-like esterase
MSDPTTPPNRLPLRVLVKGASTVVYTSWMSGPRTDFAWPRVVEAELLAAGFPAEVRCTAMPAELAKQTVRTWQAEVLTWSPDVVVLQYGHMETIHLFLPRWLERHVNSLHERPGVVRSFYRKRILRPSWMVLAKTQRALDKRLPADLLAYKPRRVVADLKQYLKHVCTVASPLVLVCEIPPTGAPYRDWFPGTTQRIATMNQHLEAMVAELANENIRWIPVNSITGAHLEPGQDATPDGGHFTPPLHRAVGEAIADVIVDWAEKQEHLDLSAARARRAEADAKA